MSGTRLNRLAKGAFVKVGSMAWDVWIHACSHILLGCGYGFEGFHGCIAMVIDAFGSWVFPSMRVFPWYILCHIFVGVFYILLHVDFNYVFF